MSVIVCGDIHTRWGSLNQLINKKSPDIVLQCGDFGWWPQFHGKHGLGKRDGPFDQYGLKPGRTKVYWAPGNHENWNSLDEFGYRMTETSDNVFYCPFGTTLKLSTDETVMFLGGAYSIDKHLRTIGVDWWPQEIITNADMDNVPDVPVDIVISHTIPTEFLVYAGWHKPGNPMYNDSSTVALQILFERLKPKKWFSGHFHEYRKATISGCEWTSLDMPDNNSKWWVKL